MKKHIALCLVLNLPLIIFSQKIVLIRYIEYRETHIILYPVKITGYEFGTKNFPFLDELTIEDSLSYHWIAKKVMELEYCTDTVSCYFPDVRQQIIIVNGDRYDILSSDGYTAMEMNGKSVLFDKELQQVINNIIEKYGKLDKW
jgi:hypothetical protein